MTTADTLDYAQLPFYLWDSLQHDSVVVPTAGVDSCFTEFLVPTADAAHDTLERPSLFVGHSLVPQDGALSRRPDNVAPAWVFPVLLALVAVVTLFYRLRKLQLHDLLLALVDSHAMDRLQRNNSLLHTSQLVPMGLLMLGCLALPVHQLAMYKTGFVGYLLFTAALALAYLLRNGLMRLLGNVFENKWPVDIYITSNYFYHFVLATVVLPVLFLLLYLPRGTMPALYVLGGLVVLEFLARLFRGMQLFLTHSSGPRFYLFYYLCLVEIAPILVLINWIIE